MYITHVGYTIIFRHGTRQEFKDALNKGITFAEDEVIYLTDEKAYYRSQGGMLGELLFKETR